MMVVVALLFGTGFASALSTGGDFEIHSQTVDNGGGLSSGGNFSVNGTFGQADASPQKATGGNFEMAGGFWANTFILDLLEVIFIDGFE